MRNSHKFLLSLIAIIWIIIIGFIFFVIGTFLAPYHVSKQEYQEYLDRKPVYVVNGYNFFNGKPLNTTLNEFGEIMENGKKLAIIFDCPQYFIQISMWKNNNQIDREIILLEDGIEYPLELNENGLKTVEENEYSEMISKLKLSTEEVNLPSESIRELSKLGKNWKLDKQLLGSGDTIYDYHTNDISIESWNKYISSLDDKKQQKNDYKMSLIHRSIEYEKNSFYNKLTFYYHNDVK